MTVKEVEGTQTLVLMAADPADRVIDELSDLTVRVKAAGILATELVAIGHEWLACAASESIDILKDR